MRQKGYAQILLLIIAVGLVFAISLLLGTKKLNIKIPPSPSTFSTPTPSPKSNPTNEPVVSAPTPDSIVKSPLMVTGTVPAGWMFEGVFPIKLVDSNRKLIIQVQAKEVSPDSWQNGNPVEFSGTLTFKTSVKSGFIVLENDNPSGNPANSKTFEVPVLINCTPRPACLDKNPRCLIAETSDMCPASSSK